jgi:alanine racemase
MRPTYLQINCEALRHNLQRVREFAPHSKVMGMIKANAYGHGLIEVARALKDADAFGVAFLEEALALRAAGIQNSIVLMEGFFNAAELDQICRHDLEIVVHQYSQLEILEQNKLNKPLTVWLKIDTGLHRLGFLPKEVTAVWQRLRACNNVQGEPHLLSHFASPDDLSKPTTLQQFDCFNTSIIGLNSPRSLANSAAIIAWPTIRCEWIRPGIMLYGVSPFTDKTGADYNLQPVMTLRSELIAIQPLQKGDAVGYGGVWTCPEDMRLGMVAIGYGDGYPRHAKNGTPVLVNGKITPLVGRVSMDMITVDLRTQPNAKIGDPVVLWGEGLPIELVARSADTIAYELLCSVTPRVRRST